MGGQSNLKANLVVDRDIHETADVITGRQYQYYLGAIRSTPRISVTLWTVTPAFPINSWNCATKRGCSENAKWITHTHIQSVCNCKEVACIKRDEVSPSIISTKISLGIRVLGIARIAFRTCVKMITTWEALSDMARTIIKSLYPCVAPVVENMPYDISTCSFSLSRYIAVSRQRFEKVPNNERNTILHPLWLNSPSLPTSQRYTRKWRFKSCCLAFLELSIVFSISMSKMVNVSSLFWRTERSISSKEPIPPPMSTIGVAYSSQG